LARVDEVERRLVEWADWKRRQARDGRQPGLPGTPEIELSGSVLLMDRIVASMPSPLRATLVEVYGESGTMAVHAEKLGCPETTIARRLGRAHLFIADHLAGAVEREREERHRTDVTEDLSRRLGPEAKE
jgi:DNA-directed RNA polymerase specialized sigma24 family protein